MNDAPRRTLRELIARHGPGLCSDARRCEGLLKDYSGEYRGEVSVLVSALEEHVPQDMLAAPDAAPREVMLARMTRRLTDNRALSERAAAWSVNSWALALGLVSEDELTAVESRSASRQGTDAGGGRDAARASAGASSAVVSVEGGGDYASITEALKAVAPGARVLVRPGLYNESIVLDKRVELVGDGPREKIVIRSGGAVALKWFFPHMSTPEQQAAIALLVRKGPPSEHFLWPLELTTTHGVAGFGYVMPLRPPRFKNIVDLMKRRIEPTFRALATAGLNLSHNYLLLHSQGLCYRDISFGNAFFDPDSGDVLIADNDNVSVDGAGVLGVLGTPRFMAPEVVRGEAVPSTQTDLFSLSVLIFYMLVVAHPLEGKKETEIKCLDLPAMTKLYGTDPLFIFDPDDDSNAPVPGIHDNALAFWRIYPRFL